MIYEPATDEILLEFAANSQKGIRYKNYFDWGILPSEAGVNNPQNSQLLTIPAPTSPVSVSNLTLQQIYEMQWSLPIYGNNPTYAGPFSNGELTLDEIYYSAQINDWVVGDLNADQVEDVALLIVERFGNTTYYHSLAVILNQNNQPVFGGLLTLEDLAGTTEKLQIQNGSILINGMWWMPGDPNCCPSKTGVTLFNLTSNGIQRLSE